jgi:uncharacterized membrane protein
MAMTATPVNMGTTDRVVRGIMGGLMLLNGLANMKHSAFRKIETLVGGAFLVYGITGFDPLLKAFGVSTIPGRENNLLNVAKQAAPGQGINPIATQQSVPQTETRGMSDEQSIADATAIE